MQITHLGTKKDTRLFTWIRLFPDYTMSFREEEGTGYGLPIDYESAIPYTRPRVPLYQLKRNIPLSRPLLVDIEIEEDKVSAWCEELKLFGVGETTEEAIEDLADLIIADHDYYLRDDAGELTRTAKRLKRLYTKLFVRGGTV